MRVMGVDYGDARTGVAVSDLLCSIVGTTTVIHSRNMEKTIAEIVRMVQGSDIGEIVVGLPKNMDGSLGWRAEECSEIGGCDTLAWDGNTDGLVTVEIPNAGGVAFVKWMCYTF